MTRSIRYWPWVLFALVAIGLGWNVYYRAVVSEHQRSDLVVLLAAGQAVLDGEDIYQAHHPRGWPFFCPPTMAATMAPLATLPLGAAVIVWYAVSVMALLWAGWRLVRLCDELAGVPVGPWVVAAFAVNFGPLAVSFQRGQVTVVLFALMVEAMWCYRAGREFRCGLLIALATALKVYPVLLALPLVVRWDRRGLAGLGVGLVGMAVLVPMAAMGPSAGMDACARWAGGILVPFFTEPAFAERAVFSEINQFAANNQSLFGVFSRWLCAGALPENQGFALSLADWPTEITRGLSAVVSVALVAGMVWCARRRAPRTGFSEAVVWALPMTAANFISHIGWHHYYLSASVLYALAATARISGSCGRGRTTSLSVVLGVAVAANWLHVVWGPCRQMGLLMFGTLLVWAFLGARSGFGAENLPSRGDKSAIEC